MLDGKGDSNNKNNSGPSSRNNSGRGLFRHSSLLRRNVTPSATAGDDLSIPIEPSGGNRHHSAGRVHFGSGSMDFDVASLYGTPKEEMQLSAGSVGSGSLPFLFSEDNDNEDVDGADERDEDDDEEGKSNFTKFKFICSKHMFYFGGQGIESCKVLCIDTFT